MQKQRGEEMHKLTSYAATIHSEKELTTQYIMHPDLFLWLHVEFLLYIHAPTIALVPNLDIVSSYFNISLSFQVHYSIDHDIRQRFLAFPFRWRNSPELVAGNGLTYVESTEVRSLAGLTEIERFRRHSRGR